MQGQSMITVKGSAVTGKLARESEIWFDASFRESQLTWLK